MIRPLLLLLLAATAGSACRVTTVERVAPPDAGGIGRSAPARAWTVLSGADEIGRVVLFEASERPEAPVFVVQDAWGHDLGMIDGLGRAWRFRPHQREAEWLATGTVTDGCAAILDAAECRLEEVDLGAAREAAAPR